MSFISIATFEATLVVVFLISFIVMVRGILNYVRGCAELIAYHSHPRTNKDFDYEKTLKKARQMLLWGLFFVAVTVIIYHTLIRLV